MDPRRRNQGWRFENPVDIAAGSQCLAFRDRLPMLFYDVRPSVANIRHQTDVSPESVLRVVVTPAPATIKLGKILAALLGEVSPFLRGFAEVAKCVQVGHAGAESGVRHTLAAPDGCAQSTSTDASLYQPKNLFHSVANVFHSLP